MEDQTPKYDTLIVNTFECKTHFTKKYNNRKRWELPNPKEIHSYIPGTILEIMVEVGQAVKEGETLLILEAMKMKNKVQMPFDGIVKSIRVKSGDKVPKGELIIELE